MFEVGRTYRRRDLHAAYGGQQQGGISTPAQHPFVLLFTGESGEQYGYRDGWDDDGTFWYTGEGQVGDMQFVRGNRAIRDHAADGKDLHVFQTMGRGAPVRYIGAMTCAGYELRDGVPDLEGSPRSAIVFQLVPVAAEPPPASTAGEAAVEDATGTPVPSGWYWHQPLGEVRAAALQQPAQGAPPQIARRAVYHRSQAVKVYVQRRANGQCEGCGQPAPFITADGRPYLEPHHTRRLSDGGPDHPAWVIAVCPTCHRRAHYASDAQLFNATLMARVNALENAERG
jgi:5-methylcytosine-specific restriction enzyme A